MHFFTRLTGKPASVRFAALVFQLGLLLTGLVSRAWAQTALPAYYSTGAAGTAHQLTQPSPQVAASCNVTGGANVTDGDFATFATLKVDATAGVAVPVALLLKLTGTAPAGHRAGVVLATPLPAWPV